MRRERPRPAGQPANYIVIFCTYARRAVQDGPMAKKQACDNARERRLVARAASGLSAISNTFRLARARLRERHYFGRIIYVTYG